jgi:hypothetical protein
MGISSSISKEEVEITDVKKLNKKIERKSKNSKKKVDGK